MYHSGIGGGGYMVVRSAEGEYEVVDFRETAPAAAHEEMYAGNVNASIWGGLAVAVPGEVRGLDYVHSKYGALPWGEVMRGAVGVARDGFQGWFFLFTYSLFLCAWHFVAVHELTDVVSSDLVRYMGYAVQARGWNFLVEDPSWAIDFAPNGTLVREGDIMKRKRYAEYVLIRPFPPNPQLIVPARSSS